MRRLRRMRSACLREGPASRAPLSSRAAPWTCTGAKILGACSLYFRVLLCANSARWRTNAPVCAESPVSNRIEQTEASRIVPEDMISALIEEMGVDDIVAALIKSTDPIELLRYIPLTEAERLSSLSQDGLERHFSHWILDLSPRR